MISLSAELYLSQSCHSKMAVRQFSSRSCYNSLRQSTYSNMFKPAPTALVSLGQPEFTHPNTSLGVYSRNKLLNFTGFFSSFEGAATPAKVAVGADIIWEARCVGALTKGIGCFFAGSTWDRNTVDSGTGARRFYRSYRSWS